MCAMVFKKEKPREKKTKETDKEKEKWEQKKLY